MISSLAKWTGRPPLAGSTQEKQATQPLPQKPKGALPNVVVLDTYAQLAEEIDFHPPSLLIQRLKNFFAENGLPIYDLDKVERYMDTLSNRKDKVWHWVPMRDVDHIADARQGGDSGSVVPGAHVYTKEIPIQVLRLVQRIPTDLRSQFRFYVSDYTVPYPDPFLMVMPRSVWNGGRQNHHMRTVIAMWDEPGFGSE